MATGLPALVATVVTLSAGSLAGIAPADAHVHANGPGAVRGGVAIVTFEVPNESPTGSPTTELTVTLPDVASARTETMPGWVARLDRTTATGAVRSVTWTASGTTGIGADQFGSFRISMKLPDAPTVRFPSAQRYADGMVVRWDQPPLPGGAEPERPVPELVLAAGPVTPGEHHAGPTHPAPSVAAGPDTAESPGGQAGAVTDNPARLLAGVALLVAALGATVAISRRRT